MCQEVKNVLNAILLQFYPHLFIQGNLQNLVHFLYHFGSAIYDFLQNGIDISILSVNTEM